MAKSSKKSRKVEVEEIDTVSDGNNTSMSDDDILENEKDDIDSEDYEEGGDKREHDSDEEDEMLNSENEEDDSENDNTHMDDDDDDDNDHEEEEEEGGVILKDGMKHEEMKELEKEYMDLLHQEQDILKNLRRNKDEDLLKGQAVRNQQVLWDKTLEFRFLLQMAFSSSNRLPQEPIRSLFCDSDDGVNEAYADLIDSAKKTLDSMLELEEALLEKNPSITQGTGGAEPNSKSLQASSNLNGEVDEEWSQIHQMHSRMASFRDKSLDKWQRKTQVTTGAAAIKGKLQAFNQNISEQVASYMRDPSRMIRGMQQRTSAVAVFGSWQDADSVRNNNEEVTNEDGNPELLDDSDFYQLLLKELFESHAASSETAFYALKRLQPKKRKIVDRRASKSRKIRYNVHEKIVNFMAPQPMNLPPMAPKLFEDLFGLKSHAPTSAA